MSGVVPRGSRGLRAALGLIAGAWERLASAVRYCVPPDSSEWLSGELTPRTGFLAAAWVCDLGGCAAPLHLWPCMPAGLFAQTLHLRGERHSQSAGTLNPPLRTGACLGGRVGSGGRAGGYRACGLSPVCSLVLLGLRAWGAWPSVLALQASYTPKPK